MPCRATAPPQPNQKNVHLFSVEKVNWYCMHWPNLLDSVSMYSAMEDATRYSAVFAISNTSMDHAVNAFQPCWTNHFWISASVKADKALQEKQFCQFCADRDKELLPVPPGRHSKNAINSKDCIIISILLKHEHESSITSSELLSLHVVSIFNDL